MKSTERTLLADLSIALDAWLHQYASEMCDAKRVRKLAAMVCKQGGTLAYIAKLQQRIREARGIKTTNRVKERK